MSCYIPIYTDINDLPDVCSYGEPGQEGTPSLFWEWKELGYLTQRRYEPYAKIVRSAVEECECGMAALLADETERLGMMPEEMRRAERTALTDKHIAQARMLCRELRIQLEKRY